MNILQGVRRLAEVLLLLSFISFSASPLTSLLGIQQPPVENTLEMLRFAILSGFVIMAVAVVAIFGFGYLVLTGWREHRKIPKSIRVLLAFALGALAFSLSGPISWVLPIPFLPTVLTTILLWAVLRAVSNAFPSHESETLQASEAIATARYFVKQVEVGAQNVDVLESKTDGKHWKVSLCSAPSAKRYHVEVDAQTGGITQWKSA